MDIPTPNAAAMEITEFLLPYIGMVMIVIIGFMIKEGTGIFLEIGNGNTLSNMIKRMEFKKELSSISLSSIKQIETFMEDNNAS